MKTAWVITCPRCAAQIEDFELSGEWFCECGESGIVDFEEPENDTE